MAYPGDLQNVDKDLFDRAWRVVQECGEEERHFNQLQSVYRGVASTWLLATFAAVGYLLFDKDGRLSHPGVSAVVCFAGAFGIGLIWNLDLNVYHRLLVAVFTEGHALEKHFTFLPKFRTNMFEVGRQAGNLDPIRKRLTRYYVGTASVPVLAGLFFAGWWLLRIYR